MALYYSAKAFMLLASYWSFSQTHLLSWSVYAIDRHSNSLFEHLPQESNSEPRTLEVHPHWIDPAVINCQIKLTKTYIQVLIFKKPRIKKISLQQASWWHFIITGTILVWNSKATAVASRGWDEGVAIRSILWWTDTAALRQDPGHFSR